MKNIELSNTQEETYNTTDIPLRTARVTYNNTEYISIENNLNEVEQCHIMLEEEMDKKVKSHGIIKWLQLAYGGMFGLSSIINLCPFSLLFTIILEMLTNLYIICKYSGQTEFTNPAINIERSYGVIVLLMAYIVYFMINFIYAYFIYLSYINSIYNTTEYGIKYYLIIFMEILTTIVLFCLVAYSNRCFRIIIPITWIYIIFQSVHLIAESAIGYFKEFVYYIYKPTTKKMKILVLSGYYINHLIILSLCLILIFYSTELVPLAAVNRIYWNKTISEVLTNNLP
ncbi:hypothetical protein NEIG_00982 [Nematocida sp. ERTm5]|nr:hypothetical protein NEIG_00982 [Nematocida sp. ERTm5]